MADRAGSSSDGDRQENEKRSDSPNSFVKVKPMEEMEMGDMGDDIERQELLASDPAPPAEIPDKGSVRAAVIWMVVNTLATIGIVRQHHKLHRKKMELY